MESLNTKDLMRVFEDALVTHYPQERFASAELAGIVQAVVNVVGWSALRAAHTGKGIRHISVRHDLSNEWMDREDILNQIESTSGLDAEMSELALGALGQRILNADVLFIEHVGVVARREGGAYRLELSEELRLAAASAREDSTGMGEREGGIPVEG